MENSPVYILTDKGFKTPEEIERENTAPEQKKFYLGSPWLSFSLLLALTAYFFNSNDWTAKAESLIEEKQKAAAAEPYRIWAQRNPLSYVEVTAAPDAYTGRSVIWDITVNAEGIYYCEQDATKRVEWSVQDSRLPPSPGKTVKALARIEGERGNSPLLTFLAAL